MTGDLLLVQLTQTDLFVGTGASIDTKGTATLVDDRLDVTGATGFHVSGASLNLATLTDSGTTYTGLELILDEVGLDGVTDLTLTVASGSVLFNEVSVGTTKLDWATTTSDNGLLPAETFSDKLKAGLDLSIGGTVLVDAFGVVVGAATFEVTQGTTTLTDTNTAPLSVTGDLLLVQLTQTDLFVGTGASINTQGTAPLDDDLDVTGAVGFHVQGASLTLATLTDSGTTYTGLELNIDEVGLTGVTDLTLTVASGSVLFNEVSTGPTKLDWGSTTSDNGLLPADTFSDKLIAGLDFAVGGTVLVDAFGVVLGTVTFSITKGTTTLTDTNTVPLSVTGDLLLVELTQTDLFVGTGASIADNALPAAIDDTLNTTGAVGFHVQGASLTLATLTDSGTTYTGLELNIDEAGLDGVPGLTLTVASGSVLFNEVSTGPTKLDWGSTTSDNGLLPADTFSDKLIAGLDFAVSGTVVVDAFGIVLGTATFNITQGTTTLTDTNTAPLSVTGDLLLVELTQTDLFVGTGASIADNALPAAIDDTLNTTGAVGFHVQGASLTLATLTDSGTTYTGLELNIAEAGLTGVPGLILTVASGSVPFNEVSTGTTKLDWGSTTSDNGLLPVDTFSDKLIASLDLSIGGTVLVDAFGVVLGTATFNMTQGTTTLTDTVTPTPTVVTGDLLLVTVTNANLFVGTGASIDTNATARLDDDVLDVTGAIGFHVSGASLNLATLTDSGTTYTGLELNIDEAGLDGVPGLTLTVASGSVLFNEVSAGTTKLDWATATSNNGLLPADTSATS